MAVLTLLTLLTLLTFTSQTIKSDSGGFGAFDPDHVRTSCETLCVFHVICVRLRQLLFFCGITLC